MSCFTISWNLRTDILWDELDGQTNWLEVKSNIVSLRQGRNKIFRIFMFQWVTLKSILNRISFCSVFIFLFFCGASENRRPHCVHETLQDIHLATSGNIWSANCWSGLWTTQVWSLTGNNQIYVFLFPLKDSERCTFGPCKKKKKII